MFSSDEMRALKVLGPMYRDVLKKKSQDELEKFFQHAYIIWDDHSPPPRRKADIDDEENGWFTNQRQKVRVFHSNDNSASLLDCR